MIKKEQFDIRDLRQKEQYITDDLFLNGYARFLGIYAVGVYGSLCRHANKEQKCWPSIRKIQEELNVSKNSVLRAIKVLEFWNIIGKQRIGKKANNRYNLYHKKHWKKISEVHIRDFSEVHHRDFTGSPQGLHRFTTGTSIVRSQKKGVKSKEKDLFLPGIGKIPSFKG